MKGSKASAKRSQVRNAVFPNAEKLVYGATEKGWRNVPRTLALIMTLINQLAPKGKGDGAARVYLELWLRDFGEGYVELTDDDLHAFASGYTTARGVRSWRECIDVLADLGFIKVAPKGTRTLGYVLLMHPDRVVQALRETGKIPQAWDNAYQQRMIEIGAEKAT